MAKAKAEPIDNDRLAAILARQESNAVGFGDGELAEQQRVAQNAYYGRPYGDEEEGRSQFVTKDVAEVVDYMTVAVLRAFVSGDHVVEFEGHPAAKQVTAAMHYLFLRKQNGYRLLHDWLKGALLERIGIIKTSVETETKAEIHEGPADSMTMAQLAADKEDIVAASPVGTDEDGEPVFHVQVRREVEKKKFRDHVVPVDEFRFANRTVSEETCSYIAHAQPRTRSQLVEMGFDRDVVDGLTSDVDPNEDQRTQSRFGDQDDWWQHEAADQAGQEVLLREEYAFVDRDGDGIAERVKAFRVGKTILDTEDVDEQPFVVFCPFPMPGVMVGQSLADKVLDIQRLRTVTTRLTLDGFYTGISPRTFVDEGSITENTLDDLLTVRPNSVVRYRGTPPAPQSSSFDPSSTMAMLEFANGEKESRTGITRLNQGLDRDALNKTATGTALMQQQGAQIEEYIARNFGECLARLFDKKLKLLVRYGEPFDINIDGEQVTVDPRQWPSDMDMNVQVGLGSGNKDKRLAYRQAVVGLQAQAKQGGVAIVTPKQLFNSAAGIVADMNIGPVNEYFTDPETPQGQQLAQQQAQEAAQQPNPAQIQAQAAQQKAQLDQQRAQADVAIIQQTSDAKIQAMREESAAKLQLRREEAAAEAQMNRERMAGEFELDRQKMLLQAEAAERNAQRQHSLAANAADTDIPSNRPGGSLDA